MSIPDRRVVHCLPLTDQLRVAKYLETHKERLHLERPTYRNLAAVITKDLGCLCTQANVRTIAHASGTAWTAKSTNSNAVMRANNTRTLARAIVDIADALDLKVDQTVYLIAAGRNPLKPGSGILEGQ